MYVTCTDAWSGPRRWGERSETKKHNLLPPPKKKKKEKKKSLRKCRVRMCVCSSKLCSIGKGKGVPMQGGG